MANDVTLARSGASSPDTHRAKADLAEASPRRVPDNSPSVIFDAVTDARAGHDIPPAGITGGQYDAETALILAVRHILSLSGMAFSSGAVRDLPELTSETFDPGSAVSALRHVGLEASLGEMRPGELKQSHCPATDCSTDCG
ncbi:hypothetical protein EV663_10627 [Rhodovulum bhavnagarense]|uniref:Uncharacterized protein n=1 Tax=Rhodovulum bhavnagarense TaxID=992286 RepID=A0A4R2RMU4_9RHOB|nr:hypothetical protein [Rhodovulum bhavnagarense]TCP61081.1 hypothetical protein EV663_10627 [Rhodovulum bhavnagarense]